MLGLIVEDSWNIERVFGFTKQSHIEYQHEFYFVAIYWILRWGQLSYQTKRLDSIQVVFGVSRVQLSNSEIFGHCERTTKQCCAYFIESERLFEYILVWGGKWRDFHLNLLENPIGTKKIRVPHKITIWTKTILIEGIGEGWIDFGRLEIRELCINKIGWQWGIEVVHFVIETVHRYFGGENWELGECAESYSHGNYWEG